MKIDYFLSFCRGVLHTPLNVILPLFAEKYIKHGRMQYAPTHLVRATYFFEDVEGNIKRQNPSHNRNWGYYFK
ncbi:hypothetical protein FW755_02005 [Lonepinella koalarum]|nr:hypothetical protein FW755_02005 [Lonepinella koalarum]